MTATRWEVPLFARKRVPVTVVTALVVIIALIAYRQMPKPVSYEVKGIKYQLGAANAAYAKPVTVRVEGRLKRPLFGPTVFQGTVSLEGEPLPKEEEGWKPSIRIEFNNNAGSIIYERWGDGLPLMNYYGTMYINNDMSELSISIFEPDPQDSTRKGWSGADGFMIAAPASNREAALTLTNKLYSPKLPKPLE